MDTHPYGTGRNGPQGGVIHKDERATWNGGVGHWEE